METIKGKIRGKFGSICCRSAVEEGRFGLAHSPDEDATRMRSRWLW
jgi:hypothetical protein